jgi:hypothetical protein
VYRFDFASKPVWYHPYCLLAAILRAFLVDLLEINITPIVGMIVRRLSPGQLDENPTLDARLAIFEDRGLVP